MATAPDNLNTICQLRIEAQHAKKIARIARVLLVVFALCAIVATNG